MDRSQMQLQKWGENDMTLAISTWSLQTTVLKISWVWDYELAWTWHLPMSPFTSRLVLWEQAKTSILTHLLAVRRFWRLFGIFSPIRLQNNIPPKSWTLINVRKILSIQKLRWKSTMIFDESGESEKKLHVWSLKKSLFLVIKIPWNLQKHQTCFF